MGNLIRQFSFVTLLYGLPSFAMASQCPSAKQLTHTRGQKWQLDPTYEHSYWQITSTRPADLSPLREMADETKLTVWLYPQNPNPLKVSCLYQFGEQAAVIVTHHRSFDPSNVPQPPFIQSNVQGVLG